MFRVSLLANEKPREEQYAPEEKDRTLPGCWQLSLMIESKKIGFMRPRHRFDDGEPGFSRHS